MQLLCSEHGMVEIPAGNRCPTCGSTALDPLDPANREAVEMIVALHGNKRSSGAWLELLGGVLAVLLMVAPFVVAELTTNKDWIGITPYLVIGAGLAIGLVVSLRHKEWQIPTEDPHRRLNALTSASMIALFVCLAFVIVKHEVGIEALWYAAGDPWWRIVTSAFTHGGLMHLVGNMIALLMFGPTIDRRVGRLRTAAIMAAAAVAGSLVQSQYSGHPGVGFSGAIYGLFGATLVLMPNRPQVIGISGMVVPMPTWGWMFVIVPLYTLLAAFDKTSNVAWVAHLAGFVAGAVVAIPMRRVPESKIFLGEEARRKSRIVSLVKRGMGEDVAGILDEEPAASTSLSKDPEVAEFHRAARRRRRIVTIIGASVLIVFGLGVFALATWMEAPAMAKGRRVGVMVTSLVVALTGIVMLRRAITSRDG